MHFRCFTRDERDVKTEREFLECGVYLKGLSTASVAGVWEAKNARRR